MGWFPLGIRLLDIPVVHLLGRRQRIIQALGFLLHLKD
jgi:hypothetical protein